MANNADVLRREKINPLFWKVIQEHDDWIVVRNWLTKKYRAIKK